MRRLLTALCLVAFAAPLSAQTAPNRQGFFLSLGLGGGSLGVNCPQCDFQLDDRLNGIAGYLRFGGTVSPNLLVGVEGSGWIKNSEGLERRVAAATLVFLAYPSRTAGFFFKAGAGGIRAVVEDGIDNLVGEGLVVQGGIGFDLYLSPGFAITPYVDYLYSTGVAADFDGVSLGIDLNPNLLQVGVALTIP
ncbi:MAG: hypothetical protein R2909_02525 [Gemmatimonadales bacterium]